MQKGFNKKMQGKEHRQPPLLQPTQTHQQGTKYNFYKSTTFAQQIQTLCRLISVLESEPSYNTKRN